MLGAKELGKNVKLCGLITTIKKVLTKGGTYMAYGTLEDLTGRIEFVVFPRTYQQFGTIFNEGQLIVIEGKLEKRRDAPQIMVQTAKEVSLESMVANAKEIKLFDEKEKYVRVLPNRDEDELSTTPAADPNAPYIINLTEKTDEDGLKYIKTILLANRGNRKVIINISSPKGTKSIAVPFGVDVSHELKVKIAEVAK